MIQVNNLTKTYKVARRNAGTKEAVRSFFSKKYDTIRALDNISFTIPDGEMVGYIGPNGAGKSSTIKILSGILTPDSGQCVINGRIPYRDRVAHVGDIGVVFGQRSGLWWDVPVIDSFLLLKDIYKIPDNIYQDSLDELITLLNLSTIVKTPTRQLSLGQRMRAEVAASLLHRPSILFLDEPTIGLDAVSKIAVRNFIKEHNREHKTTVILTTHDMQDIEAITNRIMLIGKGKLLLDGTVSDMKKLVGEKKKISIEYEGYRNQIDWSNFMDGVVNTSSNTSKGGMLQDNVLQTQTSTLLHNGLRDHGLHENALHENSSGELVLLLDRDIISVSAVITELEKYMKIKDLSSTDTSIDEVIVQLYEQYGI